MAPLNRLRSPGTLLTPEFLAWYNDPPMPQSLLRRRYQGVTGHPCAESLPGPVARMESVSTPCHGCSQSSPVIISRSCEETLIESCAAIQWSKWAASALQRLPIAPLSPAICALKQPIWPRRLARMDSIGASLADRQLPEFSGRRPSSRMPGGELAKPPFH